jgi:hypothetical protein
VVVVVKSDLFLIVSPVKKSKKNADGMTLEQLEGLSWPDLKALAKKHQVKTGKKKSEHLDALKEFFEL